MDKSGIPSITDPVCILECKRSPIGSLGGELSPLSARDLASQVVQALETPCVLVDRVYVGNVLGAGTGQNIARAIAYSTGMDVPSITVNNVCGSGMQAVIEAYNAIALGSASCIVAGGVESMTNAPHIQSDVRKGKKYGNVTLQDSMLCDGLVDMFDGRHMGEIADLSAEAVSVTREEQDEYAAMSYDRARCAMKQGKFDAEIVPITLPNKTGNVVTRDEEPTRQQRKPLAELRPAFRSNGTVTAGNASKLSDGAAFIVLARRSFAKKHGLAILVEVVASDLTTGNPDGFALLPAESIRRVLEHARLSANDIDCFEVNEAFALCPLHVCRELRIPVSKVNVRGGSVALGHPLGCTGARIITTLVHTMLQEGHRYGCAALCIGGGGASSLVLRSCVVK